MRKYETLWKIWGYLRNLKKLQNTHGGVLLFVMLQAVNCISATKSRIASYLIFCKLSVYLGLLRK